jgi:hypothetical protein
MNTQVSKYIIALIGLSLFTGHLWSQSKFELSTGVGWPGLLSIKCKYGLNFQYGSGIGYLKVRDSYLSNEATITYLNYSFEICDHVAGRSKFSDQPPWYINIGLGYTLINTHEYNISQDPLHISNDNIVSIYSKIGRTFNISEKIGFTADLGVSESLDLIEDSKTIPITILPAFGVSFFIRL